MSSNKENIINLQKRLNRSVCIRTRVASEIFYFVGVDPARAYEENSGVELGENGEIISYDIETNAVRFFQNVQYILEDSGSSWDKLLT